MKVRCPNCGNEISINGLGRRPLSIPLINICDSIKAQHGVRAAAQELGCSPAYIFKVLKSHGLTIKLLMEEKENE